jgi:hypothetical protein
MSRPYDFTRGVQDAARLRQSGKCAVCGRNLDDLEEHAHHVVPNQSGNPNDPNHDWLRTVENCVIICDVCHGVVHGGNTQTGGIAPPSYFVFSHGVKSSPAHVAWSTSLSARAKTLYNRQQVLTKYRMLQAKLKNLIDLYSSEHEEQIKLMNQSFAGFWTNKLFNTEAPPTSIWLNAHSEVLHCGTELSQGRVRSGLKAYFRARYRYLAAMKAYMLWKNGIEAAGKAAQDMIVIVAVAIPIAIVTPTAVAALAEAAGVGAAAGEATSVAQVTASIAEIEESMAAADLAIAQASTMEAALALQEAETMAAIEEDLAALETLPFP